MTQVVKPVAKPLTDRLKEAATHTSRKSEIGPLTELTGINIASPSVHINRSACLFASTDSRPRLFPTGDRWPECRQSAGESGSGRRRPSAPG